MINAENTPKEFATRAAFVYSVLSGKVDLCRSGEGELRPTHRQLHRSEYRSSTNHYV